MLATLDHAIVQLLRLVERIDDELGNAIGAKAKRKATKARRDAINAMRDLIALRDDLHMRVEQARSTLH